MKELNIEKNKECRNMNIQYPCRNDENKRIMSTAAPQLARIMGDGCAHKASKGINEWKEEKPRQKRGGGECSELCRARWVR
jgi:hypothetical protein